MVAGEIDGGRQPRRAPANNDAVVHGVRSVSSRRWFPLEREAPLGWLIVTALVIAAVTVGAARLVVVRGLATSTLGQILLSAASVPIVTAVIAALLIALQFAQRAPDAHRGSFGMVIFSIVMFWFYGLMASVLIGLPTAVVAVRAFQRG